MNEFLYEDSSFIVRLITLDLKSFIFNVLGGGTSNTQCYS